MEDKKNVRPLAETVSDATDKVKDVLTQPVDDYLTISQFQKKVGAPLIVIQKMIIWGMITAFLAVDGTLRISGDQVILARKFLQHPWQRFKIFTRALGPGVITGAADDDPSGIGTYSTTGAKFGLSVLWTAAWMLPMMIATQEICARIGIITNKGLTVILKRHYSKIVVILMVLLLLIANIVNISADIGAMAASIRLLINVNFAFLAVTIALFIVLIEIFVPYQNYVKVLKWLSLVLLAYIVTGFLVRPDWFSVIANAFIPHLHFSEAYLFAIIALFGATITPYPFFWQTSEEVEESAINHEDSKMTHKKIKHRISRRRTDIKTGMFYSNLVSFFIILTAASVLFKNGITNVESVDQVAAALRPLAGDHAFLLFALGIVGTGLLAIPVLAGSCAYAVAELMNWNEGLGKSFGAAKGFYGAIAVSVLLGLLLNFVGINPVKALYYAAYLNGLVLVPLLIVIMIVGNDKKIMGDDTHPIWVKIFGWTAVVLVVAAVVASILMAIV